MVPGLYNCFDNWGKKGAVWLMGDTHFGDRDINLALQSVQQMKN